MTVDYAAIKFQAASDMRKTDTNSNKFEFLTLDLVHV